jgi:hypothetical protein
VAIGGLPLFAAVEDDAGREDQVLNDIILGSLEDRAVRDVGPAEDGLLGDGQLGRLGSLGGTGPLRRWVAGRPGRRLEGAGGDPGPGLEALEAGDLVIELVNALFELLDALLLEGDDVEQLPHQRRAFGLRDFGQRDRHNPILPTTRPNRPGVIEKLHQGLQAGTLWPG